MNNGEVMQTPAAQSKNDRDKKDRQEIIETIKGSEDVKRAMKGKPEQEDR